MAGKLFVVVGIDLFCEEMQWEISRDPMLIPLGMASRGLGVSSVGCAEDETHNHWRKLMADADEKGKVKKVASGNNLFTDLALGEDD